MADSFVQWTGLTKLIEDLSETIPRNASRDLAAMTEDTGNRWHGRYLDNLAGSAPSTEDSPLPVGMQSGELFDMAQLELINQYAFSLYNDSDHAGYIEDGTADIAPRRPLQDVVDRGEEEMDVTLDEVMTGIIDV